MVAIAPETLTLSKFDTQYPLMAEAAPIKALKKRTTEQEVKSKADELLAEIRKYRDDVS